MASALCRNTPLLVSLLPHRPRPPLVVSIIAFQTSGPPHRERACYIKLWIKWDRLSISLPTSWTAVDRETEVLFPILIHLLLFPASCTLPAETTTAGQYSGHVLHEKPSKSKTPFARLRHAPDILLCRVLCGRMSKICCVTCSCHRLPLVVVGLKRNFHQPIDNLYTSFDILLRSYLCPLSNHHA